MEERQKEEENQGRKNDRQMREGENQVSDISLNSSGAFSACVKNTAALTLYHHTTELQASREDLQLGCTAPGRHD